MPPKTNLSKNKRVYSSKDWENWQGQVDLWIINPDELKEKICEELENNFSLSKDEAKDYYEMIKDEENNSFISGAMHGIFELRRSNGTRTLGRYLGC